jgi:hypothetical protein
MKASSFYVFSRSIPSGWHPAFALSLLLVFLAGCPAVYPEIGTRLRKVPAGQSVDPPPPADLKYLKFVSGRVPEKTRDGRTWGATFGKLADPYAKLYVNDKEVLKTNPQSQTLAPTWPDSPRGNFHLTKDDKLRVELWDNKAINDAPIGVREVGRLTEDMLLQREVRIELDGGGDVTLLIEPAHAMQGLGLWFELRNNAAAITRLIPGSPSERAGARPGDEIIQIAGKNVSQMTSDDVRSQLNSLPPEGIKVVLRHTDGTSLSVTLAEGPIYPPYEEMKDIE